MLICYLGGSFHGTSARLMLLRFLSLLSIPLYVCNPYVTSHLFDAITTITTVVIYI
jgi:hypothetical protein